MRIRESRAVFKLAIHGLVDFKRCDSEIRSLEMRIRESRAVLKLAIHGLVDFKRCDSEIRDRDSRTSIHASAIHGSHYADRSRRERSTARDLRELANRLSEPSHLHELEERRAGRQARHIQKRRVECPVASRRRISIRTILVTTVVLPSVIEIDQRAAVAEL